MRKQIAAYRLPDRGQAREFSFTLNGPYERIAGFVDELERGRQRIRFSTLKLMTQPGQTSRSKPDLSLSATFLVPIVPDAIKDDEAAASDETAANNEQAGEAKQ